MDTLVAQYSKPMFEKEYNQEDQMELYEQGIPSLSLRFAMPPVAHVCANIFFAIFGSFSSFEMSAKNAC